MHPAIESFLERPTSHKVAAWVVSLLLISGLFWQYIYGPVAMAYSESAEKLENLNTQIINERRLARNLPKFQQEVRDLEVKLKIALQELPDEKDIPDLLKSVADLAKTSGLEVTLFKPEPEVRREFFAEVPVSMSVEGAFHQIAGFFDEVGRMPRIVNIKNIEMREPKKTERGLMVKGDCVATTFRYLSEAERVPDDAQQEDGRRRRR